jgi:hypothetical protein
MDVCSLFHVAVEKKITVAKSIVGAFNRWKKRA